MGIPLPWIQSLLQQCDHGHIITSTATALPTPPQCSLDGTARAAEYLALSDTSVLNQGYCTLYRVPYSNSVCILTAHVVYIIHYTP